jgi:hypothetical protein
LYAHASRESVGLVGATGSYQSQLTHRLSWALPWKPRFGRNPLRWPQTLSRWSFYQRCWLEQMEERRRSLEYYEANYPPFANPHIRTNSFMLRRARLLALKVGQIESKWPGRPGWSGRSLWYGKSHPTFVYSISSGHP